MSPLLRSLMYIVPIPLERSYRWSTRRTNTCDAKLIRRSLHFQGGHPQRVECEMGCFPCAGRRGKAFHVKILLLDKQELIEEVRPERTTGQDLLDGVFAHLNLIETAYFGLRYQDSSNQTVRS